MASVFEIKQGDTGEPLVCVLKDRDSVPVSLATATSVKFSMRQRGSDTVLVDKVAATKDPDQVTNPGKVTYTWQAGQTDTVGPMDGEFLVTWADSSTTRFPGTGSYVDIRINDNVA